MDDNVSMVSKVVGTSFSEGGVLLHSELFTGQPLVGFHRNGGCSNCCPTYGENVLEYND